MKKVLLIGIATLLSFGIGIIGAQSLPTTNNIVKSQSPRELTGHSEDKSNTISIAAEWSREPSSIEDMFTKADAVIIGKAYERNNEKGITKTIQPVKTDNTMIYTEYDYKIKSILKGKSDLKSLNVISYGGLNNEGTYVKWEGIETLDKNKTYLLFLEEIKPIEGMEKDPRVGKYRPIDGPSGIYSITSKDAATLKNMSKEGIIAPEELFNTSLKVEEQQLEIQRKIIDAGLHGILKATEQLKN